MDGVQVRLAGRAGFAIPYLDIIMPYIEESGWHFTLQQLLKADSNRLRMERRKVVSL